MNSLTSFALLFIMKMKAYGLLMFVICLSPYCAGNESEWGRLLIVKLIPDNTGDEFYVGEDPLYMQRVMNESLRSDDLYDQVANLASDRTKELYAVPMADGKLSPMTGATVEFVLNPTLSLTSNPYSPLTLYVYYNGEHTRELIDLYIIEARKTVLKASDGFFSLELRFDEQMLVDGTRLGEFVKLGIPMEDPNLKRKN